MVEEKDVLIQIVKLVKQEDGELDADYVKG